jgi:hypothetical protein
MQQGYMQRQHALMMVEGDTRVVSVNTKHFEQSKANSVIKGFALATSGRWHKQQTTSTVDTKQTETWTQSTVDIKQTETRTQSTVDIKQTETWTQSIRRHAQK